ncbi:hypothetical protein MRY82_06875 [bacterium]|nr:hypothetical protein [bacterium]
MPKIKKGCLINARDIQIFEYLFEHRVALLEHIAQNIFTNIAYQTVVNRLNKLSHYSWLDKKPINHYGQYKNVYSISKKAFAHYIDSEWYDFSYTQLKSDSILHDLKLIEVKQKLCSLNTVVQIESENHLHKKSIHDPSKVRSGFSRLRSDAAIHFNFGTGKIQTVPLELELSQKSKKQCHKKILDYYTLTSYPLILYIHSSPAIRNQMELSETKVTTNQNSRLYFCTLDNVLSHNGTVKFKNQKGKVLTLQ